MWRDINLRELRRLGAESLREAGVLIAVFGPLDAGFQYGALGANLAALTACVGLFIGAVGAIIEASHQDPKK